MPRPPLTAFFAAVEKRVRFCAAVKKAAMGGLGAAHRKYVSTNAYM